MTTAATESMKTSGIANRTHWPYPTLEMARNAKVSPDAGLMIPTRLSIQ